MNGSEATFYTYFINLSTTCLPTMCVVYVRARVCVCVFFMFIHHRANYSHSLLSRNGTRRDSSRPVQRAAQGDQEREILSVRVIPQRRDGHEESVVLFPTVCVCLVFFFFFFFCLNVDSPQWSGPPAAGPRLIY